MSYKRLTFEFLGIGYLLFYMSFTDFDEFLQLLKMFKDRTKTKDDQG